MEPSFLTSINSRLGSALMMAGAGVVLVRVIMQMGSAKDMEGFLIILRDYVLMCVLIINYEFVLNLLEYLPEQIAKLTNSDQEAFERSIDKLFKSSPEKTYLFFKIDGSFMSELRALFIVGSKFIYKALVNLAMAFFSIMVFMRLMLNMRWLSNVFFALIIFSGFFPLIYVALDGITLHFLERAVEGKSLGGAFGSTFFGGLGYITLPFLSLKVAMANSHLAQAGFQKLTGARIQSKQAFEKAGRRVGGANKFLFHLGDRSKQRKLGKVNKGDVDPFKNYRQAKGIKKKLDKRGFNKSLRMGLDPKAEQIKSNLRFEKDWGQFRAENRDFKSGLAGISGLLYRPPRKKKTKMGATERWNTKNSNSEKPKVINNAGLKKLRLSNPKRFGQKELPQLGSQGTKPIESKHSRVKPMEINSPKSTPPKGNKENWSSVKSKSGGPPATKVKMIRQDRVGTERNEQTRTNLAKVTRKKISHTRNVKNLNRVVRKKGEERDD